MFTALGPLIASLLISAAMLLIAKAFPSPRLKTSPYTSDELVDRYKSSEDRYKVLVVLLTALFTAGFALLLNQISKAHAASLPSSRLVLTAAGSVWVCISLFGAVLPANEIAYAALRFGLKDRYEEFLEYLDGKVAYDRRRVEKIMTGSLFAVMGLLSAAAMNWYVLVGDAGITVKPFFSFVKVQHRFNDVADIRTASQYRAPNGRHRQGRVFEIKFISGSALTDSSLPRDLSDEEIDLLLRLTSERSGVAVTHLQMG